MKELNRENGLQASVRSPSYGESRTRREPPLTPEASRTMLADYLRTFNRHRRAVGLCATGGLLIALLAGLAAEPVYRARTSLNVENLNGEFLNQKSINPMSGVGDGTSEENVQTQIKLLESDTVMERTVASLKVARHPATIAKQDALSKLRRALSAGPGPQVTYDALLDETAQAVKVKPLGMTHLVEVTCDSWSAAFAAQFCNALVAEYRSVDVATRGGETERTSEWLNRQVAEMRAKVEESQSRLEAATGGNGLVLSHDSTTVGEDRLRALQAELVKAQADRIAKEAESTTAQRALPETLPGVIDNTNYRSYQAKLTELNAQLASLVPGLTEENPKVKHLRSEIRDVENGMAEAIVQSEGRVNNEYNSARDRERLIAASYLAQETKVSSNLEKMSRVALLRKDLETEQTIYQTLLQRSKEAGLASAMTASTAHVVDAAKAPLLPFSPQRGKSAAAGLALGSLVGLGFAFYKERSSRLFREPGEIQRLLHVREIGVIPAMGRATGVSLPAVASTELRVLGFGETDALPGVLGQTHWEDKFSIVAEAYRNTTFSLLSVEPRRGARVYVVSSPNAGEGKTTVASNIAVALSKANLRVALVDGDLRRPSLHRAFSVRNDFGVRDILRGDLIMTGKIEQMCKQTPYKNLLVFPSGEGTEDVVELLHSQRLAQMFRRLSQDFDVILVDTPPMLHMADARIFAGHAHGAILVVRSGMTGHEQAAAARDLLDHDGVQIIGTVLNAFDAEREGRGDYYKSYYRYARQDNASEQRTA